MLIFGVAGPVPPPPDAPPVGGAAPEVQGPLEVPVPVAPPNGSRARGPLPTRVPPVSPSHESDTFIVDVPPGAAAGTNPGVTSVPSNCAVKLPGAKKGENFTV